MGRVEVLLYPGNSSHLISRSATGFPQAEDLGIGRLEVRKIVGQALVLPGADGTPIQGIERQDHALLAAEIAELDVLLILVLEGKFWRCIADFYFRSYIRRHAVLLQIGCAIRVRAFEAIRPEHG